MYDGLLAAGVNDFSVSLDACCASIGDRMTGGKQRRLSVAGKRIAVVGSGVGGLSSAARLAHDGYEVDVFEIFFL